MGLMSIYNRSPIFLQNLFTTAQGLIYKRERYGKVYRRAVKEYSSRAGASYETLCAYQNERVSELVRFAAENTDFYRQFYKNIRVEDIRTVDDLKKLPVLPKETVRKNIGAMYSKAPGKRLKTSTSGTTGTSLNFSWLQSDMQRRMAYLDAFKMQHGFLPMKMKRASFNSSKIVPPNQKKKVFWRTNWAIKQRIYSGYHCKGDNIPYYVENLNRFRPEAIDGYPSAIYEVARYILKHHITLRFQPIAVFPTAETLLPHYKETIEKAFQCPCRDQYASSEGAPFITECRCGRLHYCMDTGVIEFGDDGNMIVTCFESHGTPLIRYEIGDRAFLAQEQRCECGSSMPVVERIEGRNLDYIQSKSNGRFTSIYMSLVSAEFANCMKKMQFVQNDLDSVDVYLATDDAYRESMNQIILDKLHYSLGADMEIRIHVVEEIPKDASGKFRLIINKTV